MRDRLAWLLLCAVLGACSGSESYHRNGTGGRGTGGAAGSGGKGGTPDAGVDQKTDGSGTDALPDAGGSDGGLGLGRACTLDSECAIQPGETTGHCSKDHVCCKTDCKGTCMMCKTVGSPGTCSPVQAGYDPNNDCPDDRTTDPLSCGNNGVCDGAGACRKYPASTPCLAWSCTAGMQTFARVCDGSGTCVTPAPATGSCGGFACGTSASVPCKTTCTVASQASDCQAPATCQPKTGGGLTCGAKGLGVACTGDAECESTHCAQGVCCATACDGICKSCALGGGQSGTCNDVPAGQDPLAQCADSRTEGASPDALSCGTDGTCDGAGACRKYASSTPCGNRSCTGSTLYQAPTCDGNGACATPASAGACAPYVCATALSCKTDCSGDADCAAPYTCRGGACTLKPDGNACSADGECLHGHCVVEPGASGGTCCNVACAGACKSCSTGTCVNAAAGAADPRALCVDARQSDPSSCGQTGVCDGAGACALQVKGTSCGAASCTGTTLTPAARCDGAGACQPAAATAECAPYVCGTGACLATCSGDAQCAGGTCTGGSCGQKPVGSGCSAASECASGFCVDGVCCSTACTGSCTSCALPGSEGVCTNVPAGQDPKDACSDNGATTCGTNGVCDGSGACAMYADGTSCAAVACSAGGDAVARGTCQSGTCAPLVVQACSPYMCDAAACRTSCTVDADCMAPHSCNAGACTLKTVGKTCASDAECAAPAGELGGHCAQGICCATACAGCNTCAVSGQEGTCVKATAGTDPNGFCAQDGVETCKQDGTCDGSGACRNYDATTVCYPRACPASGSTGSQEVLCSGTGAACGLATTLDCAPYMCKATEDGCRTACDTDADCVPGAKCSGPGGTCGWLPDGQVCANDKECNPGHACVPIPGGSSVCCDSACVGTCRSCGLTGSVGKCTLAQPGATVAADRDPWGDCADSRTEGASPDPYSCGSNGVCDGSGACQKYASGMACSAPTCSDTTHVTQSSCDGSGTCQTPAAISCGAYQCAAGACKTSCTASTDCASGYLCMSGSCELGVSLKVQSKLTRTDNWMQPDNLRIVNIGTTPVTAGDLALRFWFTVDGGTIATSDLQYWNCNASWTCGTLKFAAVSPANASADMYLEETWPGSTATLAAGATMGDFGWAFHRTDWVTFNRTNDWSWTTPTLADNTHITLYWKGILVWGIEPQ